MGGEEMMKQEHISVVQLGLVKFRHRFVFLTLTNSCHLSSRSKGHLQQQGSYPDFNLCERPLRHW